MRFICCSFGRFILLSCLVAFFVVKLRRRLLKFILPRGLFFLQVLPKSIFNSAVEHGFLRALELTTHVLNITTFHFLFVLLLLFYIIWRVHLLLEDLILESNLVLPLLVLVLSPFVEDLHGLNVFDGCHFSPVILVTAKHIELNFLAKFTIFLLHSFKDNLDLLAFKNLLIIHSCN
jgi:hypothetical protein